MVAYNYLQHNPDSCSYCYYLGDYGTVKLFFCTMLQSDSVQHFLTYTDRYQAQYSDGRLYMTEADGRVISHSPASEIDEMFSPVGLVEAKNLAMRNGWLRENVRIPVQTDRRQSNSCPHCNFLGQHTIYDLYYCDINAIPSVVLCSVFIAHTSTPIDSAIVEKDPILKLGRDLAIEHGFYHMPIVTGDALDRIRR